MKTIKLLLIALVLVFFNACRQSADQINKNQGENNFQKTEETTNELKEVLPKKALTKEERKNQIEEENRTDSLRLDTALKDALKIAKPAFGLNNFKKTYELQPDDSSFTVKIELLIGTLFDNDKKYVLLRRYTPSGPLVTYIDLYQIVDGMEVKIIERVQGGYIRDTIFDVNGDGYKDFLVHWYPAAGCCKRDVYNVYLNKPKDGKFTKDYEFINPTFSAKEKIIRGVGYGHSGDAGLYKYKWNGWNIDTVEFIYPDFTTNGQFIKTKRGTYRPSENEGTVLKAVPKEYHTIESYYWFMGF